MLWKRLPSVVASTLICHALSAQPAQILSVHIAVPLLQPHAHHGSAAQRSALPIAAVAIAPGRVAFATEHGGALYVASMSGSGDSVDAASAEPQGDLHHIAWLGQCGSSSVYVWDFMLAEMLVMGPDLRLKRRFHVENVLADRSFVRLACSTTGVMAGQGFGRLQSAVPAPGGTFRLHAPVVVFDTLGRVIRVTEDLPSIDALVFNRGAGPMPFGFQTSLAVLGDTVFALTDAATISISSGSAVAKQINLPDVLPQPISDSVFWNEGEVIARGIRAPADEAFRNVVADLPVPKTVGAIRGLISDGSSVWIVRSDNRDGWRTVIERLRVTGQTCDAMALVGPSRVLGLLPNGVLAARLGSDGIPQLLRYDRPSDARKRASACRD